MLISKNNVRIIVWVLIKMDTDKLTSKGLFNLPPILSYLRRLAEKSFFLHNLPLEFD